MTKDIDPISPVLVLNQRLKSFCRNWKNGNKIIFKILKRTWETDIKWEAGKCMFQKGRQEFAIDTELVAGDSLVLYKFTNDDQLLNVCIFKDNENVNDKREG
ncbi:hypothetical protein POM88_022672 [Heracleum sosnowskyi]|uniref:TF-B3 domain-containing protein n=1 Tax=Heracleum sosnowskyi TaxID=360622 RepID=A0AAD8IFE7_9APIA|nr:hypothetical protein POM88_022672 [Heracleum sosnowskyi]